MKSVKAYKKNSLEMGSTVSIYPSNQINFSGSMKHWRSGSTSLGGDFHQMETYKPGMRIQH